MAQTADHVRVPLTFEANRGQVDPRVRFLARGGGYTLFLTPTEAVMVLQQHRAGSPLAQAGGPPDASPPATATVRMSWVGSNPAAALDGLDQQPGTVNYLIGRDLSGWHTGVPTFSRVRVRALYPGIDAVYHGGAGGLEYDYDVAPGADPSVIRLAVAGGIGTRVRGDGALVIDTALGAVVQRPPTVYQGGGSTQQTVAARYQPEPDGTLSIVLGAYDRSRPLVIDPTLSYSTYLGGSGDDNGTKIAVDSSGAAYVIGYTASVNFPTAGAVQSTEGGQYDAFVTKLSPNGTSIVYSTYLGGSGNDYGSDVAVDGSGDAYVIGYASSANFPIVGGVQSTNQGGGDAFVAELSPSGGSLVYSTFLGGTGYDYGEGIAIDGSGGAFVTGETASTNFPLANALQTTNHGQYDVFVARLNPGGSALVYSTYLGGSDFDYGLGIAVDSSDNAYVTGKTSSTNFPTAGAFQPAIAGGSSAFVTEINASGSALVYSSYLGGVSGGNQFADRITVDAAGNAYVAGLTDASNFPTKNAVQPVYGGNVDAFATEVAAGGTGLVFSTYLGGGGFDRAYGIALDPSNAVVVAGDTSSTNFPTAQPIQATNAGSDDAFLTELAPSGAGITASTYLGGTASDYARGVAVDRYGNAYLVGVTGSTNFPLVNPVQPRASGSNDAFVAKVLYHAAPAGGPITAKEVPTNANFCWKCYAKRSVHSSWADPVNSATGSFFETVTDLSIPGDGIPLVFTRTYSSVNAATNGPLGYGWTYDYAMSLTQDATTGAVTITGPDGGQTVFTLSGGVYSTLPRMQATLVKNADGSFAFSQDVRQVFAFNASGQLIQEKDLNGYITALAYNASGQLTTITDPSGRTLSLTYTAGHITRVADSAGRTVTYAFNDSAGNLTDVTDVGGGTWHFTYDSSHHLLTATDPRTGTTTNHYDASDRVTEQDDALQRATMFAYSGSPLSASGGSTTITDPKGNVTVEQYVNGEKVAVTRGYGTPQAATWQYWYDPATLGLTFVIDPLGHATSYSYDSRGNRTAVVDALGRTRQYAYDSLNDVTSITDANGIITTLTYDTAGNLHSTSTPLVGASPAQNQLTSYAYGDPAHPGDVTAITDPNLKVWSRAYDTYGDLVETKDPLGNVAASVYNTIGWVTAAYSPEAGCTWGAAPPAGCSNTYRSSYSYADPVTGAVDEFGDVRVITDPLGHTVTKTYDADRNLTDVTDGDQHTIHTVFDAANEVTTVTRGYGTSLASTTTTDYWPDGTVKDQIDGNQHTTSYGYDAQARLTSVTTPATTACPSPCTTVYGYDAAGNRTSKQDPAGTSPPMPSCTATPAVGCTTWGYDAAGELTSITYSDGTTPNVSSISYDADGQRTGMTDGTGSGPWIWVWDSLHRMTSSTDSFGRTVLYGYDLKSQLTSITYPGQAIPVTRLYDDAGRLTSVKDWLGNTTTFSPDVNSNLGGVLYANGTSTSMNLDPADRLMGVTHTTSTGTYTFGYGRDNANQLNSVTATGLRDTHTYGYTPLNQLSQVDSAGSYLYDQADNPTSFFDNTAQTFDSADEVQTAGRISVVGSGGNEAPATSNSALTLTFTMTQGPVQANDQIILAITIPGSQSVQTPSGYTLVKSAETGTGSLAAQTIVFRSKAVGAETGVTINQVGSVPFQKTAVAAVYRGVDTVTPVDASAANTAATTTSVPAGPVTASIPGERLVMAEGAADNATAVTWTSTTVPGVTMSYEQPQESETLSATALADGFAPSAGAYSATGTFGTSANLVGILLALKPATTAYSYDARGNRVSVAPPLSAATTLTYDQADRLTAYGSAASYTYNGGGLRISKTVGGATEQFTYDHAEGLPLILQDGSTQLVYGEGGQPLEAVTPQPTISFVGTASGGNPATTTSNTATLTLPSGIQANDRIILGATFASGVNNSVATPSGFAQVGQSVKSGGTNADVLAVFQKTASAADAGATVTVTFSGLFASGLVAAVYRGVDPAIPIDVTATGSANGKTTVSTPATTTRYTGEEWVVVQGASYVGTAPESWTIAPSGMTEEAPQANHNATISAGIADKSATAPGTTGSLTSTFAVSGQLTTMFLGLKTPPQITWFHQDQLGSTRLLTDQGGQVVATFTYDSYGRLTSQTGSATTPLLYAGQYRDAESGLYYLRARYYDPATAQFLSRDPLASLTGRPYAYVGNSPLNATDPSGLISEDQWSAAGAEQVKQQCSGWQNSSLCRQAAFCDSAEQCKVIAQIAVDDFNVVENGLAHCTQGGVPLLGGYIASHTEAMQDLRELRAAFQVANLSLDYYNAIKPNPAAAAQEVAEFGAAVWGTCRTIAGLSANPAVKYYASECALAGGAVGVAGVAVKGIVGFVSQ